MNTGKLAVRKSRIHGRGVVALEALAARRKIGEVGGRWVRLPEARRRAERRARIYLIEVSRRWALDCSRGNALGKINHSCEPNGYLRVVRRRVEVYTLRTVRPGEELTVDYGQTPHRGGMPCRCGRPACRGRI